MNGGADTAEDKIETNSISYTIITIDHPRGENFMIIAIPSDKESLDSAVCVSFGRSPFYCLYNTETEQSTFIVNSAADSPGGAGIKAAQLLVDNKANILITIRCGENAAKVLQPANVELFKALNLSVADNIAAHKQNKLEPLKEVHAGYHHA